MSAPKITRRESLRGLVVLAAVDKLTDGGFAEVSYPERTGRGRPVLPPGAKSQVALSRACVACGRCMAACPERIIRPSGALATLGQPELDFRHGYCLPGCVACGTACPSGALGILREETKAHTHVGYAVWQRELCVRTKGEACRACVRKCPARAIRLVGGFPVVDRDRCTGCGACEHVCPARPETAIYVKGYDVQKVICPIDEADLVLEMRRLLKEGASVVAARAGVIAARETGRGIGPVLALLERGELKDAIVCDKVIGRAAAAICAAGGARRVYAGLMSEDAAAFLKARGIPTDAERIVKRIENREKSGLCPMEAAVANLDDPTRMVEAIRGKLEELRKGTVQ